ncbi:L,D-transpeptidase family protein [Sphingomonas jatrophae]|uniref:L,D-transpeptidase catalytic domain n=1 Tax=Sphingomonas jatrophae TaxID=1166337 RepID=A0A1I6K353_9SPHN|nr:L,D-transpeptidase family protein [Sphingomonas jatrophae]SFR85594.1 L,D-transpeptidase catalytic domain [Sphingomonas jatrophae]
MDQPVLPSNPIRRRTALAVALASGAFAALMNVATPAFSQAEPAVVSATLAPLPGAWSPEAARDLLAAIDASEREGLDPEVYNRAALRRAMAAEDPAALDSVANAAALSLARDYYSGRVADKAAFDWHIERSPYEASKLPAELASAVAKGNVRAWLEGLLPQNEQYAALRTALADAKDPVERDRLRANMERWRWMPRTLGDKYLYVNVPSYDLKVVEQGSQVASYTVVVGSPKTPTPQLSLTASSIVVNPWWNVPESIAKQGLGRGYQAVRTASGVRYRQPPGPRNSLGKVKIDMPNPHAIYLHDTPAKALFARQERALSHGCIRVQDIDQLALELMQRDESRMAFEDAYGSQDTKTVRLADQWPVYLVYFTAEADAGGVKMLKDPYGRDAQLAQRLDKEIQTAKANLPGARVQMASN